MHVCMYVYSDVTYIYHNITYVIKYAVNKDFDVFELFGKDATSKRVSAKCRLLNPVQEIFGNFFAKGLQKRLVCSLKKNILFFLCTQSLTSPCYQLSNTHSLLF